MYNLVIDKLNICRRDLIDFSVLVVFYNSTREMHYCAIIFLK